MELTDRQSDRRTDRETCVLGGCASKNQSGFPLSKTKVHILGPQTCALNFAWNLGGRYIQVELGNWRMSKGSLIILTLPQPGIEVNRLPRKLEFGMENFIWPKLKELEFQSRPRNSYHLKVQISNLLTCVPVLFLNTTLLLQEPAYAIYRNQRMPSTGISICHLRKIA